MFMAEDQKVLDNFFFCFKWGEGDLFFCFFRGELYKCVYKKTFRSMASSFCV